MAQKNDTKGKQVFIQNIEVKQVNRTNVDIQKWRDALVAAENVANPRMISLYDLYDDMLLDGHLTSVINKRKTAVTNNPIIFSDNGKEDEKINQLIETPWFHNFLNEALDTLFWGHSVFEFTIQPDAITYSLIPRKHIIPSRKIVIARQTDSTGINYTDPQYLSAAFEVVAPEKYGLILKAAQYVIYKRNGMGDYAQFCEIFGQPIIEGTYAAQDEEGRLALKQTFDEMGSTLRLIHATGTDIKLIDSSTKTPASGLYSDFIALCNAEISKLILGQTLTTEAGDKGARSLGEVHQTTENSIHASDRIFILNLLNTSFKQLLELNGISTGTGKFNFKESEDVELKTRFEIDKELANIVPISDDYFYQRYGIPKPDNYEQLKADKQAQRQSMLQSLVEPAQPQPTTKGLLREAIKGFFV